MEGVSWTARKLANMRTSNVQMEKFIGWELHFVHLKPLNNFEFLFH
jgi:hypothetical protein